MIQPQTKVKIVDNSGAKIAKCLKVQKSRKRSAKIGDFILVSIKKVQNITNLNNKKTIKPLKKEMFKGLVVTTKSQFKKNNGFYLKFSENSIILLDKNNNLISSRINGLILKSLKKKIVKLVNFSKNLI
jgi:large subunit ribosomal protein L14